MKQADQIKQKVKAYCESQGMLKDGDKVLVGVSGGADSVCLLFLLRELQKERCLDLRVVHVNHGIRREAGEDAAFVRELCRKLDVPFFLEAVDVPALAKRDGLSEEEAGRNARYQAFEIHAANWRREAGSKESGDGVKIALAHHAGDRAETLLFHLFRGSGLKGLASIPPIRTTGEEGVLVIRPLLCLTRDEIEAYLGEKGISHCQDATNEEDAYARNRIRHHVLPYAEEEICRGAVRHVNQAAELLAEAESYLEKETELALSRCASRERDGYQVDAEGFVKEPAILQKRMVAEILRRLSSDQKELGTVHVEAVRDLFYGETGRSFDLPYGLRGSREYAKVLIGRCEKTSGCDASANDAESVPGLDALTQAPQKVVFGGKIFEFQVFFYKKTGTIPEKTYTKWFDYDKIKDTLFVRTRRTGDYVMIKGPGGGAVRKPLKEYFITEKIPRDQRESLPLLAAGQHVLWIVGRRISEAVKVDEGTKRILQVRVLLDEEQDKETEDKCHGGTD